MLKEAYKQDEKVGFDVSLDFGLDIEQKMFRVSSRIRFSQQKTQPFLVIEGSSVFAIDPEAWERFAFEGGQAMVFSSSVCRASGSIECWWSEGDAVCQDSGYDIQSVFDTN
ncbi:hypothetical protein [Prosthecochloris vibrioformis]|uniref:Uncharacterized protein n=1 Tax=Prosthecochloris vibrioformis TaxID=1098 RepID=A0A5C4S0W2_PROVB|nr:hypothetical protein [Prosthecochloris vibrioformis]TNJ36839.1 hypothetical protein FGF68_04440 [Prosthecochloris vibrioformis]